LKNISNKYSIPFYIIVGIEGSLIPNTEKCEGIDHPVGDNKCTGFLPWGIHMGSIYRGG
jgi:hypothetical protein